MSPADKAKASEERWRAVCLLVFDALGGLPVQERAATRCGDMHALHVLHVIEFTTQDSELRAACADYRTNLFGAGRKYSEHRAAVARVLDIARARRVAAAAAWKRATDGQCTGTQTEPGQGTAAQVEGSQPTRVGPPTPGHRGPAGGQSVGRDATAARPA